MSYFLPRIIRLSEATDMVLNCHQFNAEQAFAVDLVTGIGHDVFAAAQTVGFFTETAQQLAR